MYGDSAAAAAPAAPAPVPAPVPAPWTPTPRPANDDVSTEARMISRVKFVSSIPAAAAGMMLRRPEERARTLGHFLDTSADVGRSAAVYVPAADAASVAAAGREVVERSIGSFDCWRSGGIGIGGC